MWVGTTESVRHEESEVGMALLNRLKKKPAEEPERAPARPLLRTPGDYLRHAVEAKIDELSHAERVRTFWAHLYAERHWWPVLLPLLAWYAWHTYHAERRTMAKAAARRAAAAPPPRVVARVVHRVPPPRGET